ncbi:DUF6520 family protein [Chryseobacterium sp. R2A-55]|uniref:DUF6520 family protein n=1 Tax=Chryseobacterium sp. R2A-55 TaxID=2744445 RepID=UPI001F3CD4F3|nr:DUF6520 family protein [Chryseobacterium sp. R2A-55]
MKKLILPVVTVLLGTGAAFGTQAAKSTSARVAVNAYRIDALTGACVDAQQQCETSGTAPCVWSGDGGTHLVEKISDNPTMCGQELFFKP